MPTLASEPARRIDKTSAALRLAALLFSVGLTVGLFLYRERLAHFSAYSYVGLFVISVLGNATVLLPVPSLAATFVAGGVFSPALAGVVSGAGMALGELSGYLAGYGGTVMINPRDYEVFRRLQRWMQRHGFLTILLLSVIPNPIFDLAGLTAGMLHMPIGSFLAACVAGKTIKGLAFAYAGAQSLPWLEHFLH